MKIAVVVSCKINKAIASYEVMIFQDIFLNGLELKWEEVVQEWKSDNVGRNLYWRPP